MNDRSNNDISKQEKIQQLLERERRLKMFIDSFGDGIKQVRELLSSTLAEKDKWQQEYPSVIGPIEMLDKSMDDLRSQIAKLVESKKSYHEAIGRVRSERFCLESEINEEVSV